MPAAKTIRLRGKLVRIHTPRRLKMRVEYLRKEIAKSSKAKVQSVRISPELNAYLANAGMGMVRVAIEKVGDLVKADLVPELKPKPAVNEEAKPNAVKKSDAEGGKAKNKG